jgi:hypothetical protein
VYAAFLQNAPVVRHTRGFTPGWYAVPRWGTPNASPTRERRTDPAEPHPQLKTTISPNITPTPSGSGTGPKRALEANSKNPRATARKPLLPRASSASAGPFPRSHQIRLAERDRAGTSIGGDHPIPRATARKLILPRAYLRVLDRSRGARHPLTPHHPNTGATIQKSSHATAGYSAASAPSDPHPESTTTDSGPPDAATP